MTTLRAYVSIRSKSALRPAPPSNAAPLSGRTFAFAITFIATIAGSCALAHAGDRSGAGARIASCADSPGKFGDDSIPPPPKKPKPPQPQPRDPSRPGLAA